MNLFLVEFKKKYLPHAKMFMKKIVSQSEENNCSRKMELIFDSRIITRSVLHAMSSGNWVSTGARGLNQTGISQTLKRETNYLSTLSHLRKISSPYFA